MASGEDVTQKAEIPKLVRREEWGAQPPPDSREPLTKLPLRFIHLFRYTNTEHCTTREECVQVVKDIEARSREDGHDEITFNFLIGEDGHAYEGRGWEAKPPLPEIMSVYENKFIDIALIGDHRGTLQSHPIYETAWQVIDCGIKNGIINENFFIIWK